MSGQKPREIAVQVLQRRSLGIGEFVEGILEKELATANLSPLDRGLTRELVCGAVRWQATLDWLIGRKTQSRPQKPMLQNLLRLGLYQIFWLDRIPNHAAVNETVESAKQGGFGLQAGFINAVLRNYLREFDVTKGLLAGLKTTQPSLGYSHPEWLVARWQKRWGPVKAAQLLEWNNTPPQNYARVNTLKAGPGQLLEQWRNENLSYDFLRHDWFDENIVFELKSPAALSQVPSFQQGWFYVQDPSTLLAVAQLDPKPGETILDLCAAPGGKTTYIAQLMKNEGTVVAHDLDPDRLHWVQENCERLGVSCVELAGPSELAFNHQRRFDRVLVDAPCSNSGVMRRRVDLRWRIRPDEIERLANQQRQLLSQAAALLKPGGTLVYSTCSLEPEENQLVIQEFLTNHANFKSLGERELLPFADKVDGAFVARLERV